MLCTLPELLSRKEFFQVAVSLSCVAAKPSRLWPRVYLVTRRPVQKLSCELSKHHFADNAGIDGSVVADEVSQKPLNMGYDANKGVYVDMIKSGIIDPVKVVRTALTNAASISGLLLTTEALVTTYDKDDKKKRKVEGSVN